MRTVSYAGMELAFKPRWKCLGIAVPIEGETLLAILKHLRGQLLKGEVPDLDCKKRRAAMRWWPTGMTRVRVGSAGFSRITRTRSVTRTRRVKSTRSRNPSRWRVKTHFGKLLGGEVSKAARRDALKKARAFWNEKNTSSLERYLEANDSDGAD